MLSFRLGDFECLERPGRTRGRVRDGCWSGEYVRCMASGASARAYDRVVERQRAVALAQHFRDAQGLSIAQIAERLGRAPSTVKAYFYDPS